MRRRPGAGWRWRRAGVAVAALAYLLPWSGPGSGPARAQERAALIAAAADLKFALADIAGAFARDTGKAVRITYGSSGDLARQIAQGAPFEVLLSADERYVFELHRAGLTRGEGTLYAVGRLAVFAPHGSPLSLDADLRGLQSAASGGQVTRFAIANPRHAPYGQAAQQVLEHLGIWQRLQPALVLGENASQAMQFAASGSCQGGIVPLSLASAPDIAALGTFERIPTAWHSPLRQRMVLTARAGSVAGVFYDYMRHNAAVGQMLARYGYALPEEQ